MIDTQRIKHRVKTIGNQEIDLLHPNPETIDIGDIAHSLGMQCRFNGHVFVFYSVAEHCVAVADAIRDAGHGEYDQLCGLLHDGQECYCGDLVQPMKTMKTLGKAYDKVETAFEAAVRHKFGIDGDNYSKERVFNADMDACATEMRDLTTYEEDVIQRVGRPRMVRIKRTLTPPEATQAFVQKFHELGGRERQR